MCIRDSITGYYRPVQNWNDGKSQEYLDRKTYRVGSAQGSCPKMLDLYDLASSQDKRYHIVEGANHMDLYDGKVYVAEAISVLAPFFEETL